MKKNLISDILKTLMFKKNVKTTQLARELELPQQTLQRVVAGNCAKPHLKTLKPIAEFFDISIEQLKGELPLPDEMLASNLPVTQKAAKRIAVLNWEEISQYIENSREISPVEYVFVDPTLSDKAFSLRLNDSSMEPYFPNNSLLIMDSIKEAKDRSFVLVKIHESGVCLFRQLLIDGEYQYLKPMNSDLNAFPMRIMKEYDTIIGVLVEFRHRYESL